MSVQVDASINPPVKAQIAVEIMNIADHMYAKQDISNTTASILIYLNLVEWYLCFLVRHLKLDIDSGKFNEEPLGSKIKELEKTSFNYKKELLVLLKDINKNRVNIVHNMIDMIFDKRVDGLIREIKIDFDEFNRIMVLIMKNYGIT